MTETWKRRLKALTRSHVAVALLGLARAVLNHLKIAPRSEELGALDDMVIELRLGALAGEHESPEASTPHLEVAKRLCVQASQKQDMPRSCASTKLRELMAKLAEQRLVPRER